MKKKFGTHPGSDTGTAKDGNDTGDDGDGAETPKATPVKKSPVKKTPAKKSQANKKRKIDEDDLEAGTGENGAVKAEPADEEDDAFK